VKLGEVAHGQRERSHPGDDEPVGVVELVVVAAHGRGRPDMLERLLNPAPGAHPVLDPRDPGTGPHTSVPLVLGTPCSVGSSATAARNARASALNAASIT